MTITMKYLTNEEFEKSPYIIQYLYMAKTMKQKIDPEKYNEALKKYPEYFQDEINYINEIKTIKYNIEDTCNIQQTPNQPINTLLYY